MYSADTGKDMTRNISPSVCKNYITNIITYVVNCTQICKFIKQDCKSFDDDIYAKIVE